MASTDFTPSQMNPLGLETLQEGGTAPKSRMSDPAKCRQVVQKLIESDLERSRVDAKIKGAIDGNPPYSRSKLKQRAELWKTNFNQMELKAAVSSALVPYYDLFSGAPCYVEVTSNYGNSDEDQMEISRGISEEVDYVLREWVSFDYNIWAMLFDFVAYGRGFLVFRDEYDFRFRHIPAQRVKVPDGTMSELEEVETLVVRESAMVHRLYAKIRDEKLAADSGWNKQAVIEAIRMAVPKLPDTTQYDYDYYQQQLKDHDLYFGIRSPTVQLAYVYIREFDNKISQYVVVEPGNRQPMSTDGKVNLLDTYLYEKVGRYDDLHQVIIPFFMETQDGSWHGAGGIGKDVYSAMEVKNRLRCTEIDLAFLRGSVILQAKNANAMTAAQLTQFGSISVISNDVEIQQSAILGDVDTMIKVNRDLDMMISNNTGIYRQRMEKPEGNPRTAEEVRLQYMNQAMLGNSSVNRFYNQLDRLYEEIYRRLAEVTLVGKGKGTEIAREFRKRCEKRGIPAEALKDIRCVRAYRNIGNGSSFMRQQSINGLAPFSVGFPESGRQNFTMDAIAAYGNQTVVDRYFPKKDRKLLPNDEMALATIENGILKDGSPVQWTPTQNNVIHAQTHLQSGAQSAEFASQTMAQGQIGQPVLSAIGYIENILAHTGGTTDHNGNPTGHLVALQRDTSRADAFKALLGQFQQLQSHLNDLKSNAGRMMQQQAQQQQMMQQAQAIQAGIDPKTQIDAAATGAKIRMQEAKTRSAMQQRQQKHDQSMALADAKTANDIAMMRERHNAEMATESD